MNIHKSVRVAMKLGLIAVIIGLFIFTLSWNLWGFFGGPLPGYQIFLFPGNLTLIYFWHPIFTEEVNFWPKLIMLLLGQFVVVSTCVAVVFYIKKRVITMLQHLNFNVRQ
jgi:hypothetical protein